MKRPDEQELRKEMSRVNQNLGLFNGVDVGLTEVAQATLDAGGVQAGHGLGMSIGDVTTLLDREIHEEDDDDDSEEENAQDDPEQGEGGKQKGKNKIWFNKANFQSQREHNVQNMIDTHEQVVKLKKAIEDTRVVCLQRRGVRVALGETICPSSR